MIAMTLFLLLIRTRRDHLVPSSVISIAIPVTLLTTPYLWAYDQILLVLPILVVVVTLAEKGYPFLLTSTLFLWMTILSLLLLVVSLSLQVDVWSALIPLIVLCLVLWQVGQKNRIIRVVSLESNLQQL
jgi:hypothetical protein